MNSFRSCGDDELAEFAHLGISIRKIAQRYSGRHPGSKTRVQASLDLREPEIQAVENGDIPFYKAKLEEELGNHVDLELILVPFVQYGYKREFDPDTCTYRSHLAPVP